jgi:hypothetical protein
LHDRRSAITAFISGAIDSETSREQLDQNRAEDAQLARNGADLGRLPDVESLLPLVERVVTDCPGRRWRLPDTHASRSSGSSSPKACRSTASRLEPP